MAVTINFYDTFMWYVGSNLIDLDGDTSKGELHNNYTFDATDNARADVVASALGTGNGYSNPGQDLTAVTWTEAAGVATFDAADLVWTATGGDIGPATDLIVYSDTSTVPEADLLMCDVDFDGPQTAGDGTDFKITWNGGGIFTISKV